MLIAKGLGPADYGRFSFLLASFLAIRQLLDMGSSTAFYTFISQRVRSPRFFLYYFYWIGLQFFLPLAVIGLILPAAWLNLLWVGEGKGIVMLAFVAAFMQSQAWQVAVEIGESQRLTHRVQAINFAIALVHIIAIGFLWWSKWLDIHLLFGLIVLEYMLALGVASKLLPAKMDRNAGSLRFSDVLREYKEYCLPLIPYAWVGFAYEYADRWLLQHFSGAVEQGYFGVSAQIANISLIATTSILRIFWKEVAEANERGDHERVAMLYRKLSRLLYMLGAVISGMLIPWSREIIEVALGPAYLGGVAVLAIMFLYPVHQCMGQIGGTMLYAASRTRVKVIIGITFMLASIVVTYFLLAPSDEIVPGYGMGAMGLAGKMVVLQFIQVNVIAWWIARLNGWRFDWHYQIVGLGGALLDGWISYHVVHLGMFAKFPEAGLFFLAAMIYVLIMGACLAAMPWLIDMDHKGFNAILMRALSYVRAKG